MGEDKAAFKHGRRGHRDRTGNHAATEGTAGLHDRTGGDNRFFQTGPGPNGAA